MSAPQDNPILRFQLKGGETVEFMGNRVLVGRGDTTDFRVPDPMVSREHLEIVFHDGMLWVRDLGSAYGTFLNGNFVEPKKLLAYPPGQRLTLGKNSHLVVTFGDPPEPEPDAEPIPEPVPEPEPRWAPEVEVQPMRDEMAELAPITATGVDAHTASLPGIPLPPSETPPASDEEVVGEFEATKHRIVEEMKVLNGELAHQKRLLEEDRSRAQDEVYEFFSRAEAQIADFHQTLKGIHKNIGEEKWQLTEELTYLRQQLATSKNELNTIEGTKAQLLKETEMIRTRLSDASVQLRGTSTERSQLARVIDQEYKLLDQAREELKRLRAEANDFRSTSEADRVQAQREISDFYTQTEGRISTVAHSLAEIQKSIAGDKRQLTQDLYQLRLEVSGAKGEVSTLENRKTGLSEQTETMRTQLSELTAKIQLAESTHLELQKKIAECTAELERARETLKRLDDDVAEQRKILEIERQRVQREGTEAQARSEAQLRELQASIKEIQKTLGGEKRQLTAEVAQLKLEASVARSEMASLDELRTKVVAENEKLQAQASEAAEKVRHAQADLAETTKRVVEERASVERAKQELQQLNQELPRVRQLLEDEKQKLERQREGHRLELRQLEIESSERKQELDAKTAKIQSLVEQLEGQKEVTERGLAALETTRKHVESEVETLRKRELVLLEANEKAESRRKEIDQEMLSINDAHGEAVNRRDQLMAKIEKLASEAMALEERESTARANVDKLKEEMNQLDAFLSSERQKRLQVAVHEAEEQAKQIAATARAEAALYADEQKRQLAVEIQNERARALDELQRERSQGESSLKRSHEEEMAQLRARRNDLEQEIAEKRILAERDLAEKIAMERRQSEARREEEAREEQRFKQARMAEISRNVEHALGVSLKHFLDRGGEDSEKLRRALKAIPGIVDNAFNPENAPLDGVDSDLIRVDVESKLRARRFWSQAAVGAGAVILLTVILVTQKSRIHAFFSKPDAKTGMEQYAEELERQRASKPKFNPPMDTQFKTSYVDNVLYTTRYLAMKESSEVHKKWVLELNQFFLSQLKTDEKVIVRFIATEATLIHELSRLRGLINPTFEKEGIQRMRDVENSSILELANEVGGVDALRKVRDFEKTFYSRYVNSTKNRDTASPE